MAIDSHRVLALVPARGGSKGVPGKNMRQVNGIPLVGYTLLAAKKSNYIDEIFLSSDDEVTLSYAIEQNVIAIRRPAYCSDDVASANSVVEHFVSTLTNEILKENPYLIYLQPTSPLRTEVHIDDALERMRSEGSDHTISVTAMQVSPFKSFVLNKQGRLEALFEEKMTNMRRQDLPQVYLPNGALYVFRLSDFVEYGSFPSNGSVPYLMNRRDSLDIDTENDMALLEQQICQFE